MAITEAVVATFRKCCRRTSPNVTPTPDTHSNTQPISCLGRKLILKLVKETVKETVGPGRYLTRFQAMQLVSCADHKENWVQAWLKHVCFIEIVQERSNVTSRSGKRALLKWRVTITIDYV